MKTHGGKRERAGRKKTGEPTKHLRIPVRFENKIKEYIALLKEENPILKEDLEPEDLGKLIINKLGPGRNLIADLRGEMKVPEVDFDLEIISLVKSGQIALMPQDDPLQLTNSDERAAVIYGGESNHIVYKK